MSEEKINENSEKRADGKRFSLKELFNYCPIVCFAFFAIGIVSLLVHIISVSSPQFADFITRYVASGVRFVLAKLTGWIPFSLAEMILILLPFILVFLAIKAVKVIKSNEKYAYSRYICAVFSVIATFYSLFVFTLGTSYQGTTLYEKLDVEKPQYEDSSDLLALCEYLRDNAKACAENITFNEHTGSIMPYSRDELNRLLNDACIKAAKKYKFISPLRSNFKDVVLSPYMTYTHISGVYSYYTGEANINTSFPDYTLPFTAAHELAHQRGIAREDEANMIAFLVCLESEDEYVQYCAYLNMFEYVISALTRADRDLARAVWRMLPENVYREELAYSSFFKKYQDSGTSQVSGAVNDAYLKGGSEELRNGC